MTFPKVLITGIESKDKKDFALYIDGKKIEGVKSFNVSRSYDSLTDVSINFWAAEAIIQNDPATKSTDTPLIEKVAKAMCSHDGINPDKISSITGKPMWHDNIGYAKAAITTIQGEGE